MGPSRIFLMLHLRVAVFCHTSYCAVQLGFFLLKWFNYLCILWHVVSKIAGHTELCLQLSKSAQELELGDSLKFLLRRSKTKSIHALSE